MTSNSASNGKGRIPSIYRQPSIVMEVDLSIWQDLLIASGERSKEDVVDLTRDEVQSIVCDDRIVSNHLIDAISVIHEFGNEPGRHLLEEASADINLDLNISDDDSDGDIAAQVWMASQSSIPHKQALMRAHTANVFARRRSNVREYAGIQSFSLTEIDETKIRVLLAQWCDENNKSGVVDIYTFKDNDFWFCNIVRGDPIKTVAAIENGSQVSHRYRPAAWDQICIEPETGKIGIASRSPKFAAAYRKIFGEVLKGNSEFFSGENICSLTPLFDQQMELFRDLPVEIQRITVSELQWKYNRESALFRGPNAFNALRNLKAKLQLGYLSEAKLNFYFAGSSRPSTVHIKVPNRIEISADEHESTVLRYLNTLGLRGRFDEEASKSLWALAPWEHSETEWRRHINEDFDYLNRNNCFTSVGLSMVNSPNAENTKMPMRVEHLQDKTVIGISDSNNIRTLTPTEHLGFKLEFNVLGALIAKALTLTGSVQEVTQGLWSLGIWNKSDKVQIHVFMTTIEPTSETALQIKSSTCGNHAVILSPETCHINIGVPIVQCQLTQGGNAFLLQKIIHTLELQNLLDPPEWLTHDLILDTRTERVWYNGFEIQNLDATMQPYKFLKKLMEAGGAKVDKYELNKYLSDSEDDKVSAQARREFIKKLEKSYIDYEVDIPPNVGKKIFRSLTGGYAINCSFYMIS